MPDSPRYIVRLPSKGRCDVYDTKYLKTIGIFRDGSSSPAPARAHAMASRLNNLLKET